MERYWKDRQIVATPEPAPVSTEHSEDNGDSILSEFDRHRLALLSSRDEDEGWQAELRRYLKDLPADVSKDMDIVKWWQVCNSTLSATNQIITIYRTMDTLTPLFNVSQSITSLVRHHPSHVSVFSLLVVKSQQSAVLN
jgi:hypothetical protein